VVVFLVLQFEVLYEVVDLVETLEVRWIEVVEQVLKVQYVMLLLSTVHNHPAWLTHLHHHHNYHDHPA
jgi:hypothetical protein